MNEGEKQKGPGEGALSERGSSLAYFSAFETFVKVVLRLVPMVCSARMITTEIHAAIRPYSMAVAPLSSFRKALSFICHLLMVFAGITRRTSFYPSRFNLSFRVPRRFSGMLEGMLPAARRILFRIGFAKKGPEASGPRAFRFA